MFSVSSRLPAVVFSSSARSSFQRLCSVPVVVQAIQTFHGMREYSTTTHAAPRALPMRAVEWPKSGRERVVIVEWPETFGYPVGDPRFALPITLEFEKQRPSASLADPMTTSLSPAVTNSPARIDLEGPQLVAGLNCLTDFVVSKKGYEVAIKFFKSLLPEVQESEEYSAMIHLNIGICYLGLIFKNKYSITHQESCVKHLTQALKNDITHKAAIEALRILYRKPYEIDIKKSAGEGEPLLLQMEIRELMAPML